MKHFRVSILVLAIVLILNNIALTQETTSIDNDTSNRLITLSDSSGNLILRLNYSRACMLDRMVVKGNEVLGNGNAAYSGFRFGNNLFSSKECIASPAVTIKNNSVKISNIKFGNTTFSIEEEWIFTVNCNDIQWQINRKYLNNGIIEENHFPCWEFNSMQTWDGAILDNGGVAWNRFLSKPGETYGTRAEALTFWNKSGNSCLRITPYDDHNYFRASAFSHQKNHVFSVVQSSSKKEINPKYGLRRFIKTGQDVFNPDTISPSSISILNTLQVLSYDQEYDRGILNGIDEKTVNEMLNTIGRYGVVDKNLYGSNGWRTGFAVLQEPWLALLGLAVNSPDFTKGYSETLEYQRDNAILPDGRVLPRWHYDASDAMPDTYLDNGFYECQWGYMLDSQPAFALNVAEQFDMIGDISWLREFKTVCEKVLDYMIKRDSDGNGLFEVIQNTHKEERGTDWLDVIWASYEVATINAYMYQALVKWAELERLLGDEEMSVKYQQLASKLKTTFNKDISEGGFWNPETKWYVHWREKDGSVYGNNFVIPVNFLAIGYGLCDDPDRKKIILDNIEDLMQKENLFIWPSCFFPYEDNVGLARVNYPYPNYENGDLFLAWAELGTRCYAEKYPETAMKYIRNVISQYESDGLAHQRYTRLEQTGAGDDILSNNIMAIVGLYRNIYGIQPRYNRLYLEPKLTAALSGTQLKYQLRNKDYLIELSGDQYSISIDSFSITSKNPFAVNGNGNEIEYFNGSNDHFSLKISGNHYCSVDILNWDENFMSWREAASGNSQSSYYHEVHNLKVNEEYQLFINNIPVKKYKVGPTGIIDFDYQSKNHIFKIQKVQQNLSEKSL